MPFNVNGQILTNTQVKLYNNKNIVKNGLILYLDAGLTSSYPGTGNVWYDLSGNGNNGTLVNGVSFSTANGGTLVFDGVDDYINIPTPNLTSTNYTVIGATRYISIGGRIMSGLSTNWLLGHWNTTTLNYYAEGWISNVNAGPSDTNWRIYAGTGNLITDQYSMYVNGVSIISNSNAGSQGPNGFSLGRYAPGNSEYSNSTIGFMLVYNRVLSDSEILQNYQAQRQRFGV